jgi:hypothetical protein
MGPPAYGRLDERAYAFLLYPISFDFHFGHGNGYDGSTNLPPTHTTMCLVKSVLLVNLFKHKLQLNGFSPVCSLECLVRSEFIRKHFLHTLHTNGLSFVWIL